MKNSVNSGTKNELQRRLKEEQRQKWARGIDPCNIYQNWHKLVSCRYDGKIQVLAEGQEASGAENQIIQEASQKLFADAQERIQAAIMIKTENREQQFLLKIEKELEAIIRKLQEIHDSDSKRITSVEEKVSNLEKTVDTKVIALEKTICGKLVMMEEKINNLKSQRSEPVQIVSKGTGRIKTLALIVAHLYPYLNCNLKQ